MHGAKLSIVAFIVAASGLSGCSTVLSLAVHGDIYGGVKENVVSELWYYFPPYSVIDLPLSAIADTVTLPYTIPLRISRPTPPISPVRIDLDPRIHSDRPVLEFSRDSQRLCIADVHNALVFDLSGRLLERKGPYEPEQIWQDSPSHDRTVAPDAPSSAKDFLFRSSDMLCDFPRAFAGLIRAKDISVDCSTALRIVVDYYREDSKDALELWRLSPSIDLVWRVEVPRGIWSARFSDDETFGRCVLAMCWEGPALLLAQETGAIIGESFLVPPATQEPSAESSPSWQVLSVDRDRRMVVCSDQPHSGGIARVVSLDPPQRVLFEVAGFWRMNLEVRLEGGCLVLASWWHMYRGFCQTTIFRVTDWSKVWEDQTGRVTSVCVSPDGKWVAFVRNGIAEIARLPQP